MLGFALMDRVKAHLEGFKHRGGGGLVSVERLDLEGVLLHNSCGAVDRFDHLRLGVLGTGQLQQTDQAPIRRGVPKHNKSALGTRQSSVERSAARAKALS